MKYRDSDITLVSSDRIYKFKDFLPSKDFLYIKLLKDNKIICCYGDLCLKMFSKKNKFFKYKDIKTLDIDFFSDYIYNLKENSSEDCSAYQFVFQYKFNIENYTCSVYPCNTMDKCNSFDVVIRKIVDDNSSDFITLL